MGPRPGGPGRAGSLRLARLNWARPGRAPRGEERGSALKPRPHRSAGFSEEKPLIPPRPSGAGPRPTLQRPRLAERGTVPPSEPSRHCRHRPARPSRPIRAGAAGAAPPDWREPCPSAVSQRLAPDTAPPNRTMRGPAERGTGRGQRPLGTERSHSAEGTPPARHTQKQPHTRTHTERHTQEGTVYFLIVKITLTDLDLASPKTP